MEVKQYSIDDIISKTIELKPKADASIIRKAHGFAERLYAGEKNLAGQDFSQHLLNTAFIVSELGLYEESVAAALLHNVIYKGKMNQTELQREFGSGLEELIEGFTKINSLIDKNKNKIDYNTLSKLVLATAKDIRVLIIKIADRLDSLRSIEYLEEKEREDAAKETQNIYVPICHKLGLTDIKWELEDLSFKGLDKKNYNKIKELVKEKRPARERKLKNIIKEIEEQLRKQRIRASIIGRVKSFYSIYQKMSKKGKSFDEIYDLLAVRIICNSIKDCYIVLGLIHSTFEPLPDSFDDYIAKPKPNGYQSIHSIVKNNGGQVFEVQIRTREMHSMAEQGTPSHWIYKEEAKDKDFDRKLVWGRQLMEWLHSSGRAKELMDSMRLGFEADKVFVLTPKSEVVELPKNSTPIDFAFAIHSGLGERIVRAKVNQKIVPLNYTLQDGDTVEVIASKKPTAKRNWLNYSVTQKAKSKIMQLLKLEPLAERKKKELKLPKKMVEAIRISKCCNPLPGNEIIAFQTTKRKISVHKKDCINVAGLRKKMNEIKIDWNYVPEKECQSEIKIRAVDRPDLLIDLLNAIKKFGLKIISTSTSTEPNNEIECSFQIIFRNSKDAEKLIQKIYSIKGVKKIKRS
ncbi:MAG: RelA/SpoT family protein [Candidatus Diapherotrites archaeon]